MARYRFLERHLAIRMGALYGTGDHVLVGDGGKGASAIGNERGSGISIHIYLKHTIGMHGRTPSIVHIG
jgi:hypothetical protein